MSMFDLGSCVATPEALRVLNEHNVLPATLIDRHASGDWGDLSKEDKVENSRALMYGARIFSAYRIGSEKIYVITESDRSSTCLLLASEY